MRQRVVSKPKGAWGVEIKPEEHFKKMRDCMSGRLSDSAIKECYETVSQLEQVDAAGVRKLIQMLGTAASG